MLEVGRGWLWRLLRRSRDVGDAGVVPAGVWVPEAPGVECEGVVAHCAVRWRSDDRGRAGKSMKGGFEKSRMIHSNERPKRRCSNCGKGRKNGLRLSLK